jgi:hypothetical protein
VESLDGRQSILLGQDRAGSLWIDRSFEMIDSRKRGSRKATDFDSFITGIKDYLVSSDPDGSETPSAKEN